MTRKRDYLRKAVNVGASEQPRRLVSRLPLPTRRGPVVGSSRVAKRLRLTADVEADVAEDDGGYEVFLGGGNDDDDD